MKESCFKQTFGIIQKVVSIEPGHQGEAERGKKEAGGKGGCYHPRRHRRTMLQHGGVREQIEQQKDSNEHGRG